MRHRNFSHQAVHLLMRRGCSIDSHYGRFQHVFTPVYQTSADESHPRAAAHPSLWLLVTRLHAYKLVIDSIYKGRYRDPVTPLFSKSLRACRLLSEPHPALASRERKIKGSRLYDRKRLWFSTSVSVSVQLRQTYARR